MHLFANARVSVITPSQDGMLFAAIQDDGQALCVWDAMTGEYYSTLPLPHEVFQAFISLAWSPDRCYVAGGTQLGQVFVWDIKTQILVYVYRGHYSSVNSVSWSPDGAFLASVCSNGSLHVWAKGSASVAFPLCHFRSNEALEVVWSPNGSLIASCWRDGRVRIWNAHSRQHIYTYCGHFSAIRSCAWSLDGTRIASAGEDDTVQVWHVPVGDQWWRAFLGTWYVRLFHLLPRPSCDSPVKIVRWSPDGSAIAAMSESGMCVWSSTDATRLASLPCHSLRSFSWLHDGAHILVACYHRVGCQSWRWQGSL